MKTEHQLSAISWAQLSSLAIQFIKDHSHQQGQQPQRIELIARIELGSMPAHIERELRRCLDTNRITYRIALGRLEKHQLILHWPEKS